MAVPVPVTTNRETFTVGESVDMARLVYKRFGRDSKAASSAWARLMQSTPDEEGYLLLVFSGDHTHHCDGYCLSQEETS